MQQRPVRIVGAGVSGLTAAIALARGGAQVAIFERQPACTTHPFRFDAVENWSTHEDLGVFLQKHALDAAPFRAAHAIEVRSFDGELHALDHRRPLLYVVRRGGDPAGLDATLKRQAHDLGVRFHHGATLPRDEADIWAVGTRRRGFFLDTGITFRTSLSDRFVILVDQRLTPKVCAYLIVADGNATLAVLLTHRFREVRALLDATVAAFQRLHPFEIRDARLRSGIGGQPGLLADRRSGPLVVGEAAGFLDYLWGFGIRHAMLSGALAAQAMLERTDYESLVALAVRPLVQTSLVNRRFYDYANNRGYRGLIRYFCARQELHGALHRFYRSRRLRATLWPLVRRSYTGAA